MGKYEATLVLRLVANTIREQNVERGKSKTEKWGKNRCDMV